MSGTNLTRAEALDRSSHLRVDTYDVTIDLTGTGPTYSSTTRVSFTSSSPGRDTFIDLIAPSVSRVTLNGTDLDVATVVSEGRIALPAVQANNELLVEAQCEYMNTGEGLHRFIDPVDNETYLYTQFQTAECRRVFAVWDQPDLKASLKLTVTAPNHWKVISCEAAQCNPADNGATVWEFAASDRISPYIMALHAGPFHEERDELTSSDGRTIPLGLFCRSSLAQHMDTEYLFDITKRGFAYYEKAFDQPYPFSKYDQLFVPEFNAGAMENVGAVTYRDQLVFRSEVPQAVVHGRDVTFLHELAHMWFGNLVTMRWWDDLWLNESFATYQSTQCAAEATHWGPDAWTDFSSSDKSWAYKQDQLPSTHPIVADMVDLEAVYNNFDGITYAKGASVLRQLVAYVGREEFDAGVRAYFKAHAWGNTELPDLLGELEKASGRDLHAWSSQWLETSGCNTLTPLVSESPDGTMSEVVLVQTAPADYPTLRTHRLAVGCYNVENGRLVRTKKVTLDVSGERTVVGDLAGEPRPDLLLVNDEDLAFAKIRLDERSLATAVAHVGDIADSLPRALVWGAAWDMTRDADMPARSFVDLVLSNIGKETNSGVILPVTQQLIATVKQYVAPEAMMETRTRAADAMWSLAQNAEGGSDQQLQFIRTFCQLACTEQHAAVLEDLLAGKVTLPGRDVDPDLEWELLVALVVCGKADQARIDAQLAKDPTATGRLAATRASAARPTAQAKAEAWDSIMKGGLSNQVQEQTLLGFARVVDPSILEPFADKYFEQVAEIYRSRTPEMAMQIGVLGYPSQLFTEQALNQGQKAVDNLDDDLSALRRTMSECRDGVSRAMRAQAKDAAAY